MKRQEKAQVIEKLQEEFVRSRVGILTNYQGLKTTDLLDLRQKLKGANGKYIVVKNTLGRFAAERAGLKNLESLLTETTAIAFGYGEPAEVARVMTEYVKVSKTPLKIKGGFLGNRVLSPGEVEVLVTLPSMKELIAKLMGQLQSPVAMLMGQLNAPISGLVNVLNARKQQLEKGN